MSLGMLPPPCRPSRAASSQPAAPTTKRAPADDGRKAATSSESAPLSQAIGSGSTAAVTDYDLVSELPLKHALELAARRASKTPINDE